MNLGMTLREALARLRRGDSPNCEPTEDVSYCGCLLPAGCWGGDGWHHARHTLQTLYLREKVFFANQRQGWSQASLRHEWAAWLAIEEDAGRISADGLHETWRPYLGTPYSYEQCPPYIAAYRMRLETAQAGKIAEKKTTYEKRVPEADRSVSATRRCR